jgi:hypothetical protein
VKRRDRISSRLNALPRRIALEAVFRVISVSIFLATAGAWRAWYRNSLALGYWSSHSDLDLTLFSRSAAIPPKLITFRPAWLRAVGEWALYSQSDFEWASYDFLSRSTRVEAFVFWMRTRSSDHFLGETDKVSTRARKWEFQRALVERDWGALSPAPFPFFIDEIYEKLSPVKLAEQEKNFKFFEPHKWLVGAQGRREHTDNVLAGGSPELLEIARTQGRWEIWGILGQVRLNRDYEDVSRFLYCLVRMFPEGDPLYVTMQRFLAYLEALAHADGPGLVWEGFAEKLRKQIEGHV